MPTAHRLRGALTGSALALALSAAAVTAPGGVTLATATAAGRTLTVAPGANLQAAFGGLRPGDTLLMKPGTYDAGLIRTRRVSGQWSAGTATARITVKAADRARKPLIRGSIRIYDPSYWTLDGLRVQATVAGSEALLIGGGRGWVVRNSEFFGARRTGAYANVSFGTDPTYGTGAPRGFDFSFNCVRDAASNPAHGNIRPDHNIYLTFAGETSSGKITRNLIFNAPNGGGIKIGSGKAGQRGASNITVAFNTIADTARGIVMHGDVRNNRITGNLIARTSRTFIKNSKSSHFYQHQVSGPGNSFVHTYGGRPASMLVYGRGLRNAGDNGLRPDPKFASVRTCSGYKPTYAKAKAYGRYGSGKWPRW
jgi:hypothetical protein